MRLLLLVFLTWHCSVANVPEFTPEETLVITKLDADAKGLVGNLAKLAETDMFKNLDSEYKKMLATFSSETIPKTFLKNVTTDLFSDENITEFFKKVENFLKDTVVGQAIQECVKENACVHPFPQLSTYKTNEDNRKTLEAARKKYAGRSEEEVLAKVLKEDDLSGNIADNLRHFVSSIKNALRSKPAEAAEAIKSFSDLPSSLSLPVNLTAILKKEGRQEHGVLETLEQVADLLAAARRAFSTCLSTPMSGDNLCKSDTEFPFHFLRDDPSNEMAFANMVAKYKARAAPAGEDPLNPSTPTTIDPKTEEPVTGSEPKPNTDKPNPDSPATAPPKPDSGASTKCCQLCLLPAMPSNHGNCKSGNQCNCGCSCNSGNTRGCRTQSKCCSSNNHCKDNCCEKGHHDDKKPVVHTEVITIPPAKASSSSSSMAAFISTVSVLATLMR